MNQICPHCGASLPEMAAFCPHCAESINRRTALQTPRRIPGRLLRAGALLLFAAALVVGICLCNRPQTVDGMGEVQYTDADGTYQILIGSGPDRFQSVSEMSQLAGDEEGYRFPSRLYINHVESGANAKDVFLKKVQSAEVAVDQPAGSSSPIVCTEPEHRDFAPEAALVSLIDYTKQSASPAQIIWTLHMESGDTIRIRMNLTLIPIHTYDYHPDSEDMSDLPALQALIDRLAEETDQKDNVNLYLPAVVYTEPLILHGRSFNLIGCEENGRRTTFAAGIQMRNMDGGNWISYFTGLDFVGDGTGVGLSTAARAWAKECRFTGWKTAVLCYGTTWANTTDCAFTDNGAGLYYNAVGNCVSDTHFTGNTFTGNGVAVRLENVPTDVELNFSGSVFTGNETDIDNRCNQALNIADAVFS